MSETASASFPMFRRVAGRLAARTDEIVEAMLARVWANPALAEWAREDTREAAAAIARASIDQEIRALEAGELPEACPEADLAVARAAAAFGAPVTVALHCYRAGQAALWDVWLDEAERLDLERDSRRELLDSGARFLTAYVDRCSAWVEQEHSRERERAIRSEEQRRVSVVRDLIDGLPSDASTLGYELEGAHVAAIVSGGRAEQVAAALAGGDALSLSVDPQTWWVWVRRVPDELDPPEGTRVALGGPAQGADGFRRAHAEARGASRVAGYMGRRVLHFRDVALEALAGRDEQRARDFVLHELGPLLTGDRREATLVETLEAYFRCGHNAVSAAAALGVHDRTVANRLHAVEELLGAGAIVSRRAEIETALRLRRLFA